MTSCKSTSPRMKDKAAPPIAIQPIEIFFGCQMTKIRVMIKINDVRMIETN